MIRRIRKIGHWVFFAAACAACSSPPPSTHSPSTNPAPSPTPDPSSSSSTPLSSLPLAQAPAPTQTFFWGTVDVTAPGFVGPPADTITVSLDAQNNPRYLSFKTLPMIAKTFGDAPDAFPLSGTKHVQLDSAPWYDGSVLDAPAPTADQFELRYRLVNSGVQCDFVESIAGTKAGAGWAVTYSETGTLWGATIDANASGTIYTGDPNVAPPAEGQAATWSAPVELTAPGFYGPPVDHLTVATDAQGNLQSFSFERFTSWARTFGSDPNDFPLSGSRQVGPRTITVDPNTPATPDHFVLRYHVQGATVLDDYLEGIDGTRVGTTLVVRYFIQGKLDGAAVDAHAAGVLSPAAPVVAGPPDAGP